MNFLKYILIALTTSVFLMGCGGAAAQRAAAQAAAAQAAARPVVPPPVQVGIGVLESSSHSAMVNRLEFQAFLPAGGNTPCNLALDAVGTCPNQENLVYYSGEVQLRGTVTFGQRYTATCPNLEECLPLNVPLEFNCSAQFQGGGFVCRSFNTRGGTYQARGEILPAKNLVHRYRIIHFTICNGPGAPERC